MVISFRPRLLQLDPGLSFDALEGSYREIPFGIGNCHASLFRPMLELFMATSLTDLVPAIIFENLDHVAAVHPPSSHIDRTHCIHTCQMPVRIAYTLQL